MFLELATTRRSIRKYAPRPVEPEKIALLVEAALRSPSSMGHNPWSFVVVTDPELLRKLARAKQHGSSFLRDAPMGIVVCADPEKSGVWIEDASIAAIYLHLAAHSLGLGSCWIQIRERYHAEGVTAESYIAGLLEIPPRIRVEAVIAAGYPDERKVPHARETLQFDKVHLNTWRTAYPVR